MTVRRANPYKVKQHFSYTASELAACLGVHKNTIRDWQRKGLEPIGNGRPLLFQGAIVRAFLVARNKARKSPCPPGTLYCVRCRQPRAPALGMVDYLPIGPGTGNLRAICERCETIMHRRARKANLRRILPGCSIQIPEDPPSINEKAEPSSNCDLEQKGPPCPNTMPQTNA